MSIATQIANLATRIGTDVKAVRALTGNLGNLTTTAKGDVVTAINEVKASIPATPAYINDSAASPNSLYSSAKTDSQIGAAIAAKVGQAPAVLDTFEELAAALGNDPSAVTNLMNAVGNRVRYDASQTLSSQQAAQARSNIGAVSTVDLGDPATDFVALYNAAAA